jgi:hypothetical protein
VSAAELPRASADAARSASRPLADRRAPWKIALVALCIAAVPYAFLVARFSFVCDDAYIAFRYSRHLAQGRGLVFNLGESPPVEGYSNFLWVVWLAPFERLGFDLGDVARATSIACGFALILCVTRFAQRTFALSTSGTILTAAFAAVLPPITMWSTGGLESMGFALCVFAAFERLCGDAARPRGVQAGVLAGFAVLLRADGALWIALVLACAALPSFVRRDARMLRAGLATLALMLVVAGAHVAWRASYYGELLPNTARVKAGLSAMRLERGFDYLASFVLAVPVLAIVSLAAIAGLRRRGERGALAESSSAVEASSAARAATVRALVFIAGATAYALYVGGDFMPMGRFILPAIPFAVVCFASALEHLACREDRAPWPACAFACVGIALAALSNFEWAFPPESWRERFHFRWNEEHAKSEIAMWRGMRDRAEQWSSFGRALALFTKPGESIVLGNIGAIGYRCDIRILDVFGLTSPEVARRDAPLVRASPGHDKVVSAEFFRDRHPTYRDAYITQSGAPLESRPGLGWSASTLAVPVEVERHSLPVEAGFPPGRELCLVRFRWSD